MPGKKINPAYAEAVKKVFLQVPYFQLLNMTMESLEYGAAGFRVPAQHKHLNPYDGVHGGVMASILDATCTWAAYSRMPSEMAVITVELKINYLAPAREGQELLSRGAAVKAGRTLGVATGELVENPSGRLVGFASATVMALQTPFQGVLADLPPKFLAR